VIRVLEQDARFRYAVAILVLLAFMIGALIPRMWIVSPREYPVVIRVRLLDLLSGPFKRRQAERVSQAGDFKTALVLWDMRLSENPCDLVAHRGYVRDLARQVNPGRGGLTQLQLRLNNYMAVCRTNLDDVAAVARVYSAYQMHGRAISLLADHATLTPLATEVLATEYIETRKPHEFGELWKRYGTALSTNVESVLCHDAWQAAWVGGDLAAKSRASLESASAAPGSQLHALRMLLAVDESESDTGAYRKHLKQLEEMDKARIQDETLYWQLLDICGKRQIAVEYATNYTALPQSGGEAMYLVRAWRRLHLYNELFEYGRGKMKVLHDEPALWQTVSDALVEAGMWDEVRLLGADMGEDFVLKNHFAGYLNYLDGVASHNQRQRLLAEGYFQDAVTNLPQNQVLSLEIAARVRKLGYHPQADALWTGLAGTGAKLESGLNPLYALAVEAQRGDLVEAVAAEWLRLKPNDTGVRRRYLMAKLQNRSHSADTLAVATELATAPDATTTDALLVASALVQAGKGGEALEKLARIDERQLTAGEKGLAQLVRFEASVQAEDRDKARQALMGLDTKYLTLAELEWLTAQKYVLRTKSATAS
jgi:hypothetical protein